MLSKYNAPTMGRTVGTYHGMRIRKFTNATRALPSVVSTTTAGVAHAGLRMPLAIAPSSLGWTLTRYGRMAVAFDRYRSAPHRPSSRPREAPRSLARLRPSPVRERISSRSHTQARKVARELLKRADTIVKHAQTGTTPLELACVCKAWA